MNTISIIIPVYKVELLIGKCIESILSQSYHDFELLLIDDGSPDKSGKICEDYSMKDSRIKVVHIKNGGPSNARNIGLKLASGRYVCFIDSDDWIEKDYLLHLINNIEEGIGVVISGHIRDGKQQIVKKHEYRIYSKNEFSSMCDEKRLYNWGYSHDKLYDLKLIKDNNLLFPIEVKYSEDLIFLLQYIQLCEWVKFVPFADYHYVIPQDHNSLISCYNSFDSEYQCYKLTRENFDKIINGYKSPKSFSWVSYLLLRAIKTQYRKGRYYLDRKSRINNLKKLVQNDDVIFAKKYQLNNMAIDNVSLWLLNKNKIKIADFCLNIFFRLRYNSVMRLLTNR